MAKAQKGPPADDPFVGSGTEAPFVAKPVPGGETKKGVNLLDSITPGNRSVPAH